ncbi:MAG: lysophospholipid acyltransferase family protein [Chloroflexi bacterium]|nr:lysophospholipid acyltransferase family protein [Chloroflexota bacterium]
MFRAAERLVPLLPQAWLPALASLFGTLAFALAGKARMTATDNVRTVAPTGGAPLVRGMFVNNAQYYLSLFSARPRDFRLADHQLMGWHHFQEALAFGRGCLLVSPHIGDINYYAEVFVAAGLPVNVLVENLKPAKLSRLVVELRRRRGVNVIVGGRGALREVYRALDRNEIVAIISDRDVDGSGQPVEFFSRRARMPNLAFVVGARRQTPVVFGTAIRQANGRIISDVRSPFIPSGDETQAMARVFEEFISRWPDQWLAFQPVFDG